MLSAVLPALKRTVKQSRVFPYLQPVLGPYRAWHARNRIRSLIRPTDVFLVGHPKSGNTWLAFMLAVLAREDRNGRVSLANVGEFVPVIHGLEALIARFESLPDPRVFRNEWPRYSALYPRSIYLVRDPRSALVSLHHMYGVLFHDERMPMDEFIDEYLTRGNIRSWEPKLVRWDRQVSWWLQRARRRPDSVLVVRYEDMHHDRREILERVSRFIGLRPSPEVLDLAVARGGFDEMRALEEKSGAESYQGEAAGRGRFVRRGKVDSWKDELSPELAQRIVEEFEPAMRMAGYRI